MNWLRFLLVIPLLLLFGGWLLLSVLRALRSGRINAGGTEAARKERPLFFWLAVVVQAAFAALALWLAVRLLIPA